MFNLAIQWQDASINPVAELKPFKEAGYTDYCLTQKQAARLIDACSDYFRPIVVFALNTGMRKNEILTLTWDRLRFNISCAELADTKNGERRYVTLNQTALDCLNGLERVSDCVFVGQRNQPLQSIRKPWAHAKREAGIEAGFRFHDLRHTYISHMIMAGVDLLTIAKQVGHKDLRMISDRYGHLLAEHRQKATCAIDGMFAPAQSRHLSRHTAKIVELPKAVSAE